MKVQTVDGHAPSISRQQVPHPLDGNLLVVKLKKMSTPGTGVAAERFNHTIDFSCSEQELDSSQFPGTLSLTPEINLSTQCFVYWNQHTWCVPDEVYKQEQGSLAVSELPGTRAGDVMCDGAAMSQPSFRKQ